MICKYIYICNIYMYIYVSCVYIYIYTCTVPALCKNSFFEKFRGSFFFVSIFHRVHKWKWNLRNWGTLELAGLRNCNVSEWLTECFKRNYRIYIIYSNIFLWNKKNKFWHCISFQYFWRWIEHCIFASFLCLFKTTGRKQRERTWEMILFDSTLRNC